MIRIASPWIALGLVSACAVQATRIPTWADESVYIKEFKIAVVDRGGDPRVHEFFGWLTMRGEFQLYNNQADMLRESLRNCISGQVDVEFLEDGKLARKLHQYGGKYVRIVGTYGPGAVTSGTPGAMPYVADECYSGIVIYATDVELAQ